MLPLINNILPRPTYNGFEVRIGETQDHLNNAPLLVRTKKKILFLCIGASTPGQISTMIEQYANALTDVDILNCCVGSEDINKWMSLSGNGWTNVESKLKANGYTHSNVQGIIMCHDDLRDQNTTFAAATSLRDKMIDFINLAKIQFVNLRHIELFSRLCEYQVADLKFQTPTGYHNGWADRLLVDFAIVNGGYINGVWVTDGCGYLWTDGETVRSDGFHFLFSWMKQGGTSIHLDTRLGGDDTCASFIFNNMKRYSWFK